LKNRNGRIGGTALVKYDGNKGRINTAIIERAKDNKTTTASDLK